MNYLFAHPHRIALLTAQHLLLVGSALALASVVALPLGVWAERRPTIAAPLVGTLGALYTIPSLALLAVLVRFLGLGFFTAMLALAAYAQFVLVRGVIAALGEVPGAAREAATALGMTRLQRLTRVEIPLAVPVLLGTLRVAAVATIALATLAGYIGGGGLGELIFYGLSLHNNDIMLAGAIPAALLAVAAEAGLRLAQRAVTHA